MFQQTTPDNKNTISKISKPLPVIKLNKIAPIIIDGFVVLPCRFSSHFQNKKHRT